jgi:hypothetical protein
MKDRELISERPQLEFFDLSVWLLSRCIGGVHVGLLDWEVLPETKEAVSD